ncbi:YtxH domain-containing protein [Bacillus sp. AFS015802]|uniref:YtxH domain-containing protein n=1 Tax=Bacillus sp. AFS015802 TaxID=2033486 RepID=UPI00211D1EE9|nr:YtxH domain-containing protein [Bacillus sp. AFS015802]
MTQPVPYQTGTKNNTQAKRSGKLVKGMVVGAVVGGALAMLDKTTRKNVSTRTSDMKDSTMGMVAKVRENPSGIVNDWQDRLKTASSVLKEAITDAQSLYEKVNDDVIDQVNQIKEDSTEMIATTKEAAEELKDIGGKVKEAGEEVTGDSTSSPTATSSTSTQENNVHPTNRTSSIPGQVGS